MSTHSMLALAEGEPSLWEQLQQNLGWSEAGQIAVTVLGAVLLSRLIGRYGVARLQRIAEATDNDVDDRMVRFVRRFYRGIIAFATLLVVLGILEIEITPLLAGAGIIGIGVAYAARDIIGNFLAGVVLLVDRPVKVGDRISIERIGSEWGAWGDVVDVGLRTTTVRNTDGVHVTYPNAKLSESIIKNFSPGQAPVRFRIRVLVDLAADLGEALATLERVAGEHEAILDTPAPSAVIRSLFDESGGRMYQGAVLELRCYTDDIRTRTRVRSELLLRIAQAFRTGELPLAQLEINLGSGRRDAAGEAQTGRDSA